MLSIKILGPNYANSERLEASVRQAIAATGVSARVESVTNPADYLRWPVLATPGLVVNERLVVSGRIPEADEIARWLTNA